MTQVALPWYPQECQRNYQRRHHWRKYRAQVKAYGETCGWLVKVAGARGLITRIDFHPPHLREDDDNIIGAFKSARDSIAAVLGVNDRKFRPQYVFGDPDRPRGKIIVTIEEA